MQRFSILYTDGDPIPSAINKEDCGELPPVLKGKVLEATDIASALMDIMLEYSDKTLNVVNITAIDRDGRIKY